MKSISQNAIEIFFFESDKNNSEIRTFIDENGDIWFVAKDIAKILEIKNISDAVSDFDKDEVSSFKLDTFNPDGSFNKQANLLFLAESGLYSLIMRSRKPVAKPFQKWVTKDVLPTIRKTGSYSIEKKVEVEKLTPQKSLEIVENGIQLLKKFRELNPVEQIELDTFYKNETSESLLEKFGKNFEHSYFLPTELGKMTGQTGVEINLILEKKGFQFRHENGVWKPTSSAKEFCLEIGNTYNQLKWKLEVLR
jgi:prophage antirepressor-like protein